MGLSRTLRHRLNHHLGYVLPNSYDRSELSALPDSGRCSYPNADHLSIPDACRSHSGNPLTKPVADVVAAVAVVVGDDVDDDD